MKVTRIVSGSMFVNVSPADVPGLTKPVEAMLHIDGLRVCSVDAVGISLWSREYQAGTTTCRLEGTRWTSSGKILKPPSGSYTRPTVAGLRTFGEVAEAACEYVQNSFEFSDLAIKAEKRNASVMLQWQERELRERMEEVSRITNLIQESRDVLDLPEILTPDEHRLAGALMAAGHTTANAVLAAKALQS